MNIRLLIGLLIIGAIGAAGVFVQMHTAHTPVQPAPATAPPSVGDFVAQTISESRDLPPFANPSSTTINASTSRLRASSTKASAPKVTTGKICAGRENDFDCYSDYYAKLAREEGTKAAFDDVRARYDSVPLVKAWCHPIAHVIGRVAAEKFVDVADAYAEGDSFCWSGYYHGVMESIIGRIGFANLANKIDTICAGVAAERRYSFDHYNCVHGLGHGVMAVTEDELFDSLAMCDRLKDNWEQSSCWSGVFMENIIVDGINHTTKYLKPAEPLYPCSAVDAKYKSTCYLIQTSYMLKVTGEDFVKVFDLCSTIEETYRPTCYESLGRDVSGRSSSDVAQTVAGCALGKDIEQRKHCIIGAVKDFISYLHSDERAKELCGKMTEAEVKSTCFDTAEWYSKVL